jgi:multiple sugar transport system ATP-binding protein
MTLADRIAVMRAGVIEQIGTPADLYEHPANLYVAGFIGSPQMNFLTGDVVEATTTGAALNLAGGEQVPLPAESKKLAGQSITLGVRPEHWHATDDPTGLKLQAQFIEWLGSSVNVHLHHGGKDAPIIWHHVEPARVREGETVRLMPDPDHVHLFDQAGQSIQLH